MCMVYSRIKSADGMVVSDWFLIPYLLILNGIEIDEKGENR